MAKLLEVVTVCDVPPSPTRTDVEINFGDAMQIAMADLEKCGRDQVAAIAPFRGGKVKISFTIESIDE